MAVGRITGPLLASNLLRDGIDIQVQNGLLYLDVTNNKVGINTQTPAYDLDVNATIHSIKLVVDTTSTLGLLTVSKSGVGASASATISTVSGPLNITPAANQTVFVGTNTTIGGNLHAQGNITADGNIILGSNQLVDTLALGAEIISSIIPKTTNTYNIGSTTSNWANGYFNGLEVGGLNISGTTIAAAQAGVGINIGATPAQDINVTPITNPLVNINGPIRVWGDHPLGTAPVVSNVLYVTMDGDDTNDGRAMDPSRACRTISGATKSPFYQSGTSIKVSPGRYLENNPIELKPYTSVIGSDLRTTDVEPINKTRDLFHVQSGCYVAQMRLLNGRSGLIPGGYGVTPYGYKVGNNRGAYATAFPTNGTIDLYHSPYIQNVSNQSGPWLYDGTMFIPNQTVQIPEAVGTASYAANTNTITVTLSTGSLYVGQAVNSGPQDEGYFAARSLLLANEAFIQEQVVAWTNQEYGGPFQYNSAKCTRDTGLIIDGLALDVLYQGNSQSVFSGLQYWNQSGYVGSVGGEVTTTTAAINWIASLTSAIILGQSVPFTYQNTITQTVVTSVGNSADVTAVQNDFKVITNILTTGTTAVTDKIIPNGAVTTATHTLNAYAALQANRSFLQAEAIAWVEANKTIGFTYNQAKCYRDTGLIVDAIVQDMLFGGTSQSTFAGIQYYNQTSSVIPGEQTTTTAAISYISQLAQRIVVNDLTGTRYQSTVTQTTSPTPGTSAEASTVGTDFSLIVQIINSGTAGVTDLIVPNGIVASSNANIQHAYALLQANKNYMEAEATAFVNSTYPSFSYSGTKCARDIGYMVDSVAFDLLYGGNRQAIQSGVYYYGYSGTSSAIPGEQAQTLNAYNFINNLITDIVTATPIATPYQYTATQVTSLPAGTTSEVTSLQNNLSVITSIITGGPSSASAPTSIPQTISANSNVLHAAAIVEANRTFIQAEVIAYTNSQYAIYDQAKCARDTGLIVDALAFDLLYPTKGNSQSTFAGLQYWNQGTYIKPIGSEIITATNAILFASKLAQQIVVGSTAGPRYQSTLTQITNLTPATSNEVALVAADFNTVIGILNNGTAGVTENIVPNTTASSTASIVAAYNLLNANRQYIQAETVAYVDSIRGTFPYNHSKCERDTRLVVDALVQDLIFQGSSQTVFSGLQYWNQTTTAIPGEVTTTTNAINYVSSLAQKVIANNQTGIRYQSTVTQNVSFTPGTSAEQALIGTDFSVITDLITNGTAGVSDMIVPNGITPSSNNNVTNAYNILQANRAYLIAEGVAYVESTKTSGFTYDGTKCQRDIGYMVDSVSFDLLYGGNRQAIQSGVYYFGYSTTSSAIPGEITETVAGYAHIGGIISSIIQGFAIGSSYQTWVSQTTSGLGGTTSEVNYVQTLISTLENIIQNGPSQAPAESPISLTRSNNPNVLNAATLLHNNREFITQEVVAYIDATYNTNTFTYNEYKCKRDTGLIVDALLQDLYFGGTSQSTFAGIQYWNQTTTTIPGEVSTTTSAIAYVSSLAQRIVMNDTTGLRYSTSTQVTNLSAPGTAAEATVVANEFATIVNIITTGTTGITDKIIPNGITPSTKANVLNAYTLLEANKSYLQAEAVAYITATAPSFVYDKSKCARDVAYMVDSVAFDLKWGGNRQAIQSGTYYFGYSLTSSAIPNESTEVLDAYTYLSSLVGSIVTATPVVPYQTAISQVSNLPVATNTEVTALQNNVSYIKNIIANGPNVASAPTSIPLAPSASSSVYNAVQLLEANRAFIQAELTAYINNKYNVFTYNEDKCFRDTGYIVDSIAFDLLHGGNRQATQAGVYYYGFSNTQSAIPGEQANTVAAYDRIKSIIGPIILGQPITKSAGNPSSQVTGLPIATQLQVTSLQSLVDDITNIIDIGPSAAASAIPISLTASSDVNAQKAFNYLMANRSFIVNEVIAYVNAQYGTAFEYDAVKCKRDIGYMIDCVSFDLLRGGNRQAIQAGTLYFGYNSNSTTLINELKQTVMAYEYMATLVNAVVQNQALSNFYQSDIPQTLIENAPSTSAIAAELVSDISLMTRIISNGPSEAPALIPISLTESADANRANAYALLEANRSFIVAEIIAFVNTLPNFVYDQAKCYRDVGIIVENLAFDISFGGNQKAVESGLGYYKGVTSVIQGETTQTIGAINYINTLANYIINNQVAPNVIGSTATQSQVINTALVGGGIASTALANGVSIITDIIQNGPSAAPDSYIGAAIDPAYMSAEILLQLNRSFIQEEVVSYVNAQFLTFPYDSKKCSRDTGLIVDAVAFDMLYPSNPYSQSTFAAIQYWSQNGYTGAIESELSTTTNAISYLSGLASRIILNDTTGARYQNNITQTTIPGAPATQNEVVALGAEFSIITEIINNYTVTGLPITDGIVPNGNATTSITINNAYALLQANRQYLQAETVAWVEANKTAGFNYDRATCFRDAGYMIDSVSFDLLHGGNRQAVQSGVYYYSYTSGSTQISGQTTQTVAAFNHIATVAEALIRGQVVTPTTGNLALPVTGLPTASAAEVTQIQNIFANITNLIQNGPSVLGTKQPIGLTPSQNINVQHAYNILEANRAFLQAEMVAWVDYTYNSNGFNYNQALCYRDTGFIVDAISQDILLGGNHKSIEAAVTYWVGSVSAIPGEITQTMAAYNYLAQIASNVVSNSTFTQISYATQIVNPFYANGNEAIPRIESLVAMMNNIIENGPSAAPEGYDGSGLFPVRFDPIIDNVNIAPQIASLSTNTDGSYTVGLTQNTVGAGTNYTMYFGQTSVYPVQTKDVPENWAQRAIDPFGSMGGSLVDGAVISRRSPIQSFVYDAYTQINQGGVGIKITNNGYAQLVSVFTIFCGTSVVTDNGGICSITNSNANFGDYCLVSKGYGYLDFFGEVYNPPKLPYYPNGVYPSSQVVEVYCPDPNNRPHIGQIMEVVAPEGYTNNQGLPGFLSANPNTSTITTGTVTINGIDNSGIVIGQNVYIIDQYGNYTDINGTYYCATGTTVADVGFQSVTLSKALQTGGGDANNPTYFTIYVSGNAYYTVLSSVLAPDPLTPGQSFISAAVNSTGNDNTAQEAQAITFISNLADSVVANTLATALQNTTTQITQLSLTGGVQAVPTMNGLFDQISYIITNGLNSAPSSTVTYGTPVAGAASAASLLLQNKAFFQAETLAYLNSLYFVYDHATCRRDLGYILNGFAYDVFYQSNYQSRKCGNAYQRAASAYVLQNEMTQTTDAISHIASLVTNLAGISNVGEAISNVTQGAVNINNIIDNGTSSQPALVLPDYPGIDLGVSNAKTLILDNMNFIKAETIAWINANYTVFTYDQAKCTRDLGYILDALSADILTGSNYRAVKAGQAYYRGNANNVINNELTETVGAFNYISGLVQALPNVAASSTATTQVINDIVTINNIVQNGLSVSPTVTYPLPAGIDSGFASASQLIQNNLGFIQSEVEGYVFNTFGGFTYNQAKCYRDTGLIVDAVAQDILFGGTSQSTFAGIQYWNQTTTTIPGEVTTTTNAINYVAGLAQKVLLNDTTGVRYQSTVTQVTNLPAATSAEQTIVSTDFSVITNIITNGTAGVTDIIVPNGVTSSSNANVQHAYAILEANKAYLQAEGKAYVDATKTSGFTYDGTKCVRDIGYMVDSVAFDLLYGGNRQAVQSGVYYFGYSNTSSAIPNESVQVTQAYNYISSILPSIIEGTAVTTYQSTVTQVTNLSAGTVANANTATSLVANIVNIITNGPTVAASPTSIGLTQGDANAQNTAKMLEANRTFIQAQTIAYINQLYPSGFTYDRSKCKRDVGFLTQALIYDLTYGGNSMSVDAALQYFNSANNNVSVIPNETPQTVSAINYINTLAQKVIRNTAPTTVYTTATQYINNTLTLGANAANTIATLVTDMSNIVQNGPGAAPLISDINIPVPGYANLASTTIEADKYTLASETITWINQTYTQFTYNQDTCKRDIQFIVEGILYDLMYGGNWQSVDAGLQYWKANTVGETSLIPNEIPETAGAVNFIGQLFSYIVTNTQPASYYQNTVAQYINPSLLGGSDAVPTLTLLTNIVSNIISNGINSAPAIVYPTAPAHDNAVSGVQTIISSNSSTMITNTLAYIDAKYNGFEYNQAICKRDVGLIIDAIATDLANGGNYQSVLAGQSYFARAGTHHLVTLEDNVADATLFPDKNRINFYRRSYMSASGYLFEYVGAGSNYGALPYVGYADPIQAHETIQLNNGKVFFTSTDQNGDFRIGPGLVISQATGVLSGRTFTKSLFANLTPFVLAIEGL